MRIYDLLDKKKRGMALERGEYDFWIKGACDGDIADYQTSAMLMACAINGVSEAETKSLTYALAESGNRLDLSAFGDKSVDKHSSGGVGDSTTFIVMPILAACGYYCAKVSGRALGHTGGTLDKLEAIDGLSTNLSHERLLTQLRTTRLAVCGQNEDICPGDRLLYALRDVTATVDCEGLIASSIMSKKLALGAKNIILDVKCGKGALLNTVDEARSLASLMVKIGTDAGRNVRALITDMNAPLSRFVGNALEVYGALRVLRGEEKGELYTLSLALASQMLDLCGQRQPDAVVLRALESGAALARFGMMVEAQGGERIVVDEPDRLLTCKRRIEIYADADGYIASIDASAVARVESMLGGARSKANEKIDASVGVELKVRIGDKVERGAPIALLHCGARECAECAEIAAAAIEISKQPPQERRLVLEIVN